MSDELGPVRRTSGGVRWLGWLVGIPIASAIVSVIASFDHGAGFSVLALAPLVVGARLMLGTLDNGGLWATATWACAAGIALPCLGGTQVYMALRGDEVNADLAMTAALVWLGCWLLGFVLLFVLRARRARAMRR